MACLGITRANWESEEVVEYGEKRDQAMVEVEQWASSGSRAVQAVAAVESPVTGEHSWGLST